MMSTVSFIKKISSANDTMAHDLYAQFLNYDTDSFTNSLIREVENLYNTIISEQLNITEDQKEVLKRIFEKFKDVQEIIDPNRLKGFSYVMTEDDDLILSRNNEFEAINLIIHPEDDFSLSIIHKVEGDSLTYFDNHDADFEHVVYSFLK